MKEIILDATLENIEKAVEFVNIELEKAGCPMKIITQFDIVIDELFGNIANYAYNPQIGAATLEIEVDNNTQSVVLTFLDNGIPYDPLKKDDPDITLTAEERQIGGLGIFMVKQMVDDITYEYKDGHNIIKVKKKFNSED